METPDCKKEITSTALSMDGEGNMYVSGGFYNKAIWGDIEHKGENKAWNLFVARLNKNRRWDWVSSFGGESENKTVLDIDLDVNGNIYITGGTMNDTIGISKANVLPVGGEFHLKLGKDRIYYAGMPSEDVYSIVQRKSMGYQGYAWNLFYSRKRREIIIDGVKLYVERVTPDEMEIRIV